MIGITAGRAYRRIAHHRVRVDPRCWRGYLFRDLFDYATAVPNRRSGSGPKRLAMKNLMSVEMAGSYTFTQLNVSNEHLSGNELHLYSPAHLPPNKAF